MLFQQNFFFKLLILLFLMISALNANLIIQDNVSSYKNFTLHYFYDETSSLSIKDIQETNFIDEIPNQFTKGYKYGNAWFKLELQNDSSNEDFVLHFTESIWSTLDLYSQDKSSLIVQKNGLNIPLTKRSIQDSSPSFHLHINSGENTIFYIKGNTVASQIGEFQIFTNKEFFRPSRITTTQWYSIYVFILLTFILLNLYNYIATKEPVYIYYIAYVFTYIVFTTMHSGLYINLGFPNWPEGLHVLGILTLVTLLQFSIEFLKLNTTYPRMRIIFNYFTHIALLFAVLLSQNVIYATIASNIFFSFVLLLIVYVAIKVFKEGFDGAKYYLIALMLYLPSMSIMAMAFNTILPNNDITRYAFLFGAFVETFFFTIILANRYMDANNEKLLAQNALIEEKDNNEKRLEDEIQKQTHHLLESNSRLLKQTDELKIIKEQLTKKASTDMLSGLYNRRYFFEASQISFDTAIRYAQELSILMLDIDKFKNINDSFGHVFGDRVIRIISNILKEAVRDSDIVARYGGEEFIILLPQSSSEEAYKLAERIRLDIQNTEIENTKLTISIGLTQLDIENDVDIEQSILRCDKALYQAKNNGRNQVVIL